MDGLLAPAPVAAVGAPADAAAGAAAAVAAAPEAGAAPPPVVAQPLVAVAPQPPAAAGRRRRAVQIAWWLVRAAWWSARWCGRSATKGVTWAAVAALLIAGLQFAAPLSHLGTMMGVAASVSVTAGKVVDGGLGAVVTAAQGVSEFAVTSSRRSASLMQEAWHGVDLTDLQVYQRHAERVADDPDILVDWMRKEFLSNVTQPPGAAAAVAALTAASVSAPHGSESWQVLLWPGEYQELHVTYDLMASGFFGLHVCYRRVAFRAQWSNPLWSSLEYDLGGEREAILAHLNATLQSLPLPTITYLSMSDREVAAARLPGAWLNMARRLFRVTFLSVKALVQVLLFGQ